MIKQQYIIDKKTKRIYKVDEVYVADSENIVVFTKNGPCLPINQIKVNPSYDDIPIEVSIFTFIFKLMDSPYPYWHHFPICYFGQ